MQKYGNVLKLGMLSIKRIIWTSAILMLHQINGGSLPPIPKNEDITYIIQTPDLYYQTVNFEYNNIIIDNKKQE